MSKGEFINFQALDPVVSATITDGRRREASRGMSQRQRKQSDRDKKRNRRSIDIDPDLERYLQEVAVSLDVPFSDVIGYLIFTGIHNTSIQEMAGNRVTVRSLNFGHKLPLPGKKLDV
jgi:hypothetical protein